MWTLYTMTESSHGLKLPQTPIFSSKNKWKGQKGYIYTHTSLQSFSADTFWATANPLGWKQLLIITYRGKVSVLGLETVSIPKICVWQNMFRQDSKKCTQEFKKWIGSQRKMLQNTSADDRQVGGDKRCSFSSAEQPTCKIPSQPQSLLRTHFVWILCELRNRII